MGNSLRLRKPADADLVARRTIVWISEADAWWCEDNDWIEPSTLMAPLPLVRWSANAFRRVHDHDGRTEGRIMEYSGLGSDRDARRGSQP